MDGSGATSRRSGFSLRSSLATRLLAGGLAFTVVLIAGVSGFLLVSRQQQTDSGALSNADNRAGVAAQLLSRVTEPQAQYAATSVAALASMQEALAGRDVAAAVAQEFGGKAVVSVPGVAVTVLDAAGRVVYTTECDSAARGGAVSHPATATCEAAAGGHVGGSAQSVKRALGIEARTQCRNATTLAGSGARGCPAGIEGTELLAPGVPAFDVAVPVFNTLDGSYAPLGVVVYSAPFRTQFARFGPVIGYTPAFVPAGAGVLLRFAPGAAVTTAAPRQVTQELAAHPAAASGTAIAGHAIYTVPGTGEVAGSFVPVAAPGGGATAGYLGVEVPLSLFAAATAQDERTIGEMALTAMVVVALLILVFVDRFVRRPVRRLEHAVGRIAAGDYSADVPVLSEDELGRLAASVNRMRAQIAGYVRHIDGSLQRLQDVSRALTTTTGGIRRLQEAVLKAAVATAGGEASASLLTRRGDDLLLLDIEGEVRDRALDPATVARIVGGQTVRIDRFNQHLLAVPMFYQGAVTGAIVIVTESAVFESDQRTLQTLANNAAVAIENTRMFEQERETVQRLTDLNRMKSEFLANAQHELRTPVLAIQGELELLTRAWERWDDSNKMDTIRDIEISTRMLDELLDTVVDFSLLSGDTLELRPEPVDVSNAADDALADIRGHFKGDLPVDVMCFVSNDAVVQADPQRFRKVLRALLDNAVKFTPPGGHVSLQAHPESAAGMCRIDVIDDGCGISAEALPHIFDRFYQADGSRTRRHGGMGLGLSLVRSLCDAHGASVSVQSEVGGGSAFTLHWPIAVAGSNGHSKSAPSTAAQRKAGVLQVR